jgi:hypothetical protein
MGSRSVCRAAAQSARRIGKQRASAEDCFSVSTVMMSKWFVSASNAAATMPKGAETQQPPEVAPPHASQPHTSAVLVPPQQVDGTKVAVKLEDEYPFDAAPVHRPLSRSDQVHFAPRSETAPRVAENAPASSASSNLDSASSQAHSSPKTSIDQKETAKFAAIAATWYVCTFFRFSSHYSSCFKVLQLKCSLRTLNFLFNLALLIIPDLLCVWLSLRWDPKGPYKPLHVMNPTRVSYVRSSICKHFRYGVVAWMLHGCESLVVSCMLTLIFWTGRMPILHGRWKG